MRTLERCHGRNKLNDRTTIRCEKENLHTGPHTVLLKNKQEVMAWDYRPLITEVKMDRAQLKITCTGGCPKCGGRDARLTEEGAVCNDCGKDINPEGVGARLLELHTDVLTTRGTAVALSE